MEQATINRVSGLVQALMTSGAYRATQYLSDKLTLKATRILYRNKRKRGGRGHFNRRVDEFMVTAGPPNFAERKFIKLCKKAGEPLPVGKVQLKYPPQRDYP